MPYIRAARYDASKARMPVVAALPCQVPKSSSASGDFGHSRSSAQQVDDCRCLDVPWHVSLFVCLSVRYNNEPCKNGWTDRDAARGHTDLDPSSNILDWAAHGAARRVYGGPIFATAAMRPVANITVVTCQRKKSLRGLWFSETTTAPSRVTLFYTANRKFRDFLTNLTDSRRFVWNESANLFESRLVQPCRWTPGHDRGSHRWRHVPREENLSGQLCYVNFDKKIPPVRPSCCISQLL